PCPRLGARALQPQTRRELRRLARQRSLGRQVDRDAVSAAGAGRPADAGQIRQAPARRAALNGSGVLGYSSSARSFSSTEKSSSVVTSPRTAAPAAISRRRRRMIFPERVLGSESVKRI